MIDSITFRLFISIGIILAPWPRVRPSVHLSVCHQSKFYQNG